VEVIIGIIVNEKQKFFIPPQFFLPKKILFNSVIYWQD
jgi:hypothetical protein